MDDIITKSNGHVVGFFRTLDDMQVKIKNIGLLLCQNKDCIMAKCTLSDVHKSIGLSDYELEKALPKDIKSGLPFIDDLEKNLSPKVMRGIGNW